MSLRPRKISSEKVRGVFSAAAARLKKRKCQAAELKKKVLEGQLAQALSKAQKTAGGISSSGVSLLKTLRERGHDGGKGETPEAPSGGDTPTPKKPLGKKPVSRHPVIHMTKKEDIEPRGKRLTAADKRARNAFLLHFQSAERREWGLTYEVLRFRRALIKMWFEFQQKLQSKGELSPADTLLYEVVMELMIFHYGSYTKIPTKEELTK